MIRYAALRISLLVVVGALLYLAGMRGVLLAGSSVIIAALVAYIFFPGQRDRAVATMEEFRHKEEKPRVLDEDMEFEDSAVDELLGTESAEPQADREEDDPDGKLQ